MACPGYLRVFIDLEGQFPGRGDTMSADGPRRSLIGQQPGEDRQQKGRGLARPGLGLSGHIPAGQRDREGFGLDGGAEAETCVVQSGQNICAGRSSWSNLVAGQESPAFLFWPMAIGRFRDCWHTALFDAPSWVCFGPRRAWIYDQRYNGEAPRLWRGTVVLVKNSFKAFGPAYRIKALIGTRSILDLM